MAGLDEQRVIDRFRCKVTCFFNAVVCRSKDPMGPGPARWNPSPRKIREVPKASTRAATDKRLDPKRPGPGSPPRGNTQAGPVGF
jgi:hypothetical protein